MLNDERTILDLLLGLAYNFKEYPTIGIEEIYDDISLVFRDLDLYMVEFQGIIYTWPVEVERLGLKHEITWVGR